MIMNEITNFRHFYLILKYSVFEKKHTWKYIHKIQSSDNMECFYLCCLLNKEKKYEFGFKMQ